MQPLTTKATKDDRILCIYHEDCVDGFLAAWVVGYFFGFENVQFHPTGYDESPPPMKDRTVFIVDFSYKPDVISPYARLADKVTVIDHHKTSALDWVKAIRKDPSLAKVIEFNHNVDASGAVLTWNYFFSNPKRAHSHPMPFLFNIAQDHDLWQLKLHRTREIIAAIKATGFILHQSWREMSELIEGLNSMVTRGSLLRKLEEHGGIILKMEENHILNTLRRNMTEVKFAGHIVPMCGFNHHYATDAGKIMCKGYPFSITYEDFLGKGERKFSLRSDKESGVDVELIARRMGGGGHPNAAGFIVSLHRDLGTYIQFL